MLLSHAEDSRLKSRSPQQLPGQGSKAAGDISDRFRRAAGILLMASVPWVID